MTLIQCPDCGREISDRARACPGCGRLLQERGPATVATEDRAGRPLYFYEYKSQTVLFGLPLIHVSFAPVWLVGFRPARGIIAVGNIAIGFAAFGGVAMGLVAFGGISLGLMCVGGIALALGLGAGGIATGYWALGGIAVGVYALGGLGIGAHTLQNDPNMLRFLSALFGRGAS
jgi:zinc-ribbon domain